MESRLPITYVAVTKSFWKPGSLLRRRYDDSVASILRNGSLPFIWTLCRHWTKGLRKLYVVTAIQTTVHSAYFCTPRRQGSQQKSLVQTVKLLFCVTDDISMLVFCILWRKYFVFKIILKLINPNSIVKLLSDEFHAWLCGARKPSVHCPTRQSKYYSW